MNVQRNNIDLGKSFDKLKTKIMGCDIHLYTETKRTVNDKLVWVNVDNWKINPYYEPGKDGEREYDINYMYHSRNYSLFSLLAGVRDYSEKTIPVSPPKGLPDDISEPTKREAERWNGDGHTHSWLTLAELKAFQAAQPTVTHSGLIHADQAKALDENGITPDNWCQGTNQPNYVRREWSVANDSLNSIIKPLEEKLRDEFWVFGDKPYDPALDEKIRIVFWFDN